MTGHFSSWNLWINWLRGCDLAPGCLLLSTCPPALWGQRTEHGLISRHVDLALLRDCNGLIYLITFGTSLDSRSVGQKSHTLTLHARPMQISRKMLAFTCCIWQAPEPKWLNKCPQWISHCLLEFHFILLTDFCAAPKARLVSCTS